MSKLSPLFLDYVYGTSPEGFVERERRRLQGMDRSSLLSLLKQKQRELPLKLAEVEASFHLQHFPALFKKEIENIQMELASRPVQAPPVEACVEARADPAAQAFPSFLLLDTGMFSFKGRRCFQNALNRRSCIPD
jgi:hypothetical protein